MQTDEVRGSRGVRWWPALIVLVGAGAALGWIWFEEDAENRQNQVMTTQTVLLVAGVLLLLWIVFLARLSGKRILATLLIIVVLVGGFFAAFRYEGVSGDLIPVFVPRWREVRVVTGVKIDASAQRGDYPQFLGEARDGVVRGIRLAKDWDASPPKLLWRRPVGVAWSAFAVAGDRAVTQEQHGEEERVVCYDLATGSIQWSHEDQEYYQSALAGNGPRATPTIHGGTVYALGATGLLNALVLETGAVIWSRKLYEDAGAAVPTWGGSSSPLILDDRVIVGAGGNDDASLVAYDAASGEIAWKGGTDGPGYSSPLVTTLAGKRQVVMLNKASVAAHDPEDGHVLWSRPWPAKQPNVAQPLPVGDDRLLVSTGYGVGSRLFELKETADGSLEAEQRWRSARLKSKFAHMILHDGHVYGLDDGILTCLDVETGRRRWKGGRYGHGQIIRADDVLLIMAEDGDVVLVALTPEEHRELTRFQAIDGKVWNPPALAGSLLLVRNDKEAALFSLPLAPDG